MKFLHTSDWHLGRQFHNVSLLEEQKFILEQLVSLAEQHQVDAVVVAGDIYDRSVPPAAAVELLDKVLEELCGRLGIHVVLISGNHDSAARLRFGASRLKSGGLHIVGQLSELSQPVILEGSSGQKVQFFGIPYADPEWVRDQFPGQDPSLLKTHDQAMAFMAEEIAKHKDPAMPSVAVAHCFVVGGVGSESERPLSIGGADQVRACHFEAFDYAALGHLHGPQKQGLETIRYSGSPLKYSFSEQHHQKSVVLVTMEAGETDIQLIPLTPQRDMRVIEGELEALLVAGKDDLHRDDYLMVRLTDTHAILDPMGKLRSVYPNVLHLERVALQGDMGSEQQERQARLQQSEMSMFEDFFSQVQGDVMNDEQRQALQALVTKLHKGDE
ncbi:exonuclease SbcCD subunit D [Corallincola platygyrae]|uniref:Nuclease SbcCD subunit D n=1 Tax=Corallincola platygyrae TaxID=1193278 RepID=A0ABW4XV13_9GAMM